MDEDLDRIIKRFEAELDDAPPDQPPPGPTTLEEDERKLVEEVHRRRQATLGPDTPVRAAVIRSLCMHTDMLAGGQLGVLRIAGGRVTGSLDLTGLNLDMALRFEGTHFDGGLRLEDTRVLSIDLHGGSAAGIDADRVEIGHDLVIDQGFVCNGAFWLRSSNIGGDLNCRGASFISPAGAPSIQADGARIGGRLFVSPFGDSPFHANHGVYGRNTRIGGGIFGRGGRFDRELVLTRAVVEGKVGLRDAVVGSAMTDEPWPEKIALDLEGLIADGEVDLRDTQVGANRVVLRRAKIEGRLAWGLRGVQNRCDTPLTIDLSQACVRMLDDQNLDSWDETEVILDGFEFDAVSLARKEKWRQRERGRWSLISQPKWLWRRLDWLNQQPEGRWSPFPYDQLRMALLNSGEESAARETAIRRERVRRQRGGLGWLGKCANWIYGLLLGYGYKPARFFLVAFVVVAAFWGAYEIGLDACDPNAVNATCGDFAIPEAGSPPFRSLMFSIDAFVPIDLNQTDAWVPSGSLFSYLVALETALGWLLAGLLLGAVTGILRRD